MVATLASAAVFAQSSQPTGSAESQPAATQPAAGTMDWVAALYSDDAATRREAVDVLGRQRSAAVLDRLAIVVGDRQASPATIAAAVEAVVIDGRVAALRMLAGWMSNASTEVARLSRDGLLRVSGHDWAGDPNGLGAWLDGLERADDAARWQRQRDALLQSATAEREAQANASRRLIAVLREQFVHADEAARATQLIALLGDPLASVRRLGLELVQETLARGAAPPPAAISKLRGLLRDSEPGVRARAVAVVATLRDGQDEGRLLQMLADERDPMVIQAIANGLGYIGSDASAPMLTRLALRRQTSCAVDAVVSLGRLAERGVLTAERRELVLKTLLEVAAHGGEWSPAWRERLAWSFGRFQDPRCATQLLRWTDASHSDTVRLTAARGLSALLAATEPASRPTDAPPDAPLGWRVEPLNRLAELARDAPTGELRLVAIQALAQFGESAEHLACLRRIADDAAADQAIRETAWRGVLRSVSAAGPAVLLAEAEAMREQPATNERAEALLRAADEQLRGDGADVALRAEVRIALARRLAQRDALEGALALYLSGWQDLHRLKAETPITEVAVELLDLAISHAKYDVAMAQTLAKGNPPLAPSAAGQTVVRAMLRLAAEVDATTALTQLSVLEAHPPAEFGAPTLEALSAIGSRLRGQLAEEDRRVVEGAVRTLLTDANHAGARAALAELGPRQSTTLRSMLREALEDPAAEDRLVALLQDLLRGADPNWPGLTPELSRPAQIAELDAP